MIEADMRKAVYLLHEQGTGIRQIARQLGLSRNTVREIIKQQGEEHKITRSRQDIDEELLARLYAECEGYAARVQEKLAEEEGIEIKYSTLTDMLRRKGISRPTKNRCDRVPDRPGEEMQHDTTIYTREVGGKKIKLVASILYLRYSKRKYLKLYQRFNRFTMKCFLHEALMFWGYSAGTCIIDNTNLARLKYVGKHAIIAPEMEAFAQEHGFRFVCHALNHPNRKAGEERCFRTTETNFLPGRTFESMEDLNRQALEWSTVTMENRPQSKSGLIPAIAFEYERSFLTKLPDLLPAPYQAHERSTDQYGYAAFAANFYWVPGTAREKVKVLEYAEKLKICSHGECLVEYPLAPDGVKNQRISPEGKPPPRYQPNNRPKPTQEEEKRLRAIDPTLSAYLDFALKPMGRKRHHFLRRLHALSRKTAQSLFIKSIERAHKYTITDIETIERIIRLYMTQDLWVLPEVQVDEYLEDRETFRRGSLSKAPDLTAYDALPENDDEE